MKKIMTLFTATKAKQLLRDNLKIKGKQRGDFIIVEDNEYDKSLELIRRRERHIIKSELIKSYLGDER